MTLSYRIIKSENLQMSQEGIQISRAEPVKKVESVKVEGARLNKTAMEQTISAEDRERILTEYKKSLENEKETILGEIKAEAEKNTAEAVEEAKKSGYMEGHKEGFQKGYDEALIESQEIREEARQSMLDAQREIEDYIEREKENIIRLAGQMAERIVNHEIELSSQTIVDLLNPVLQEFRKGGTVIIYCNKKHIRKLKENIFSLKKINGEVEYLIMDNPQLDKNEFTLEYNNQILDLEISGQIQSMVQQVLDTEV